LLASRKELPICKICPETCSANPYKRAVELTSRSTSNVSPNCWYKRSTPFSMSVNARSVSSWCCSMTRICRSMTSCWDFALTKSTCISNSSLRRSTICSSQSAIICAFFLKSAVLCASSLFQYCNVSPTDLPTKSVGLDKFTGGGAKAEDVAFVVVAAAAVVVVGAAGVDAGAAAAPKRLPPVAAGLAASVVVVAGLAAPKSPLPSAAGVVVAGLAAPKLKDGAAGVAAVGVAAGAAPKRPPPPVVVAAAAGAAGAAAAGAAPKRPPPPVVVVAVVAAPKRPPPVEVVVVVDAGFVPKLNDGAAVEVVVVVAAGVAAVPKLNDGAAVEVVVVAAGVVAVPNENAEVPPAAGVAVG